MPYLAPAKQQTSATTRYEKIQITGIEGTQLYHNGIRHILHLPGGQRIIIYLYNDSFRVWDLEKGAQDGEEWKDKGAGVRAIALSPDSKTVATGSFDGAVRLWNSDTGKVIKKWTGHTAEVRSVCWSSDGGRVVSGSRYGTFRVWDVESGTTILGPTKAGEFISAVCYSPDAKMIATAGGGLNVWDANTGKLRKEIAEGFVNCLVWTSDGKTLIASGGNFITKFDTAMWSETAVLNLDPGHLVYGRKSQAYDAELSCRRMKSLDIGLRSEEQRASQE